jgi:ADP-heptose:LPS heptosyltransferase
VDCEHIFLVNFQTYGDYVLKTKFIRALAGYQPASISVVTNRKGQQVYRMLGESLGIHFSIYVVDRANSRWANFRSVLKALRFKSDRLFCLDQNKNSYVLSFMMRSRHKIGFYQSIDYAFRSGLGFSEASKNSRSFEFLIKRFFRTAMLRRPSESHESDVDMSLLAHWPMTVARQVNDDVKNWAWRVENGGGSSERPYIYVSTQSRLTIKSLSTAKTVELIGAVRLMFCDYIIYFADETGSIGKHFSDPDIRLYQPNADLMSFRDFIRDAVFIISVDSFPVHMASFCDTPIVALYGPASASRFAPTSSIAEVIYDRPECSPCVQREGAPLCEAGHERCVALERLDIGQVMDCVRRISEKISLASSH